MKTDFKIIVMVFLAFFLVGSLTYSQSLRSKNKKLLNKTLAYQVENQRLKKELEDNIKALAQREAYIINLTIESNSLKKELEVIYNEDTEAKAWAVDCLPDSIFKCLR